MDSFHIERDFLPELHTWNIEVDGRGITIWDDGDIVIDTDEDGLDMLLPHQVLREICNAAEDYFVARYKYKLKEE